MNLIATVIPAADVEWGHMGDWGAGSWLAMIAFWALIIVLLVWAVREFVGPRPQHAPSPTDLLQRRLAAGEIDVEEYRERRAAIEDANRSTR